MKKTKQIRIQIPEDVSFSDLNLSRDAETGSILFNWTPVEKICEASGVDVSLFKHSHEDNISGLLVQWYYEHLAHGGKPDAVAEELRGEVFLEDFDSKISH
jgi:hypothetical protein